MERKNWLISFLFLTIIYLFEAIPDILSAVEVVICSYILYHCAYKKSGTKFLAFIMILFPFYMCDVSIYHSAA